MDYTTVALVKAAKGASVTTDDTLLATYVTNASRAIDRFCSGAVQAADYFALGDISGELLAGLIDVRGRLMCYPHKVMVNSVAALAYRVSPRSAWVELDLADVTINSYQVTAWIEASEINRAAPLQARISYNGGFGASVAALPADLVEAATVLTLRFYEEAKTGLSDAVGVAELGMLTYTRAWPVRVQEMLAPFRRVVAW